MSSSAAGPGGENKVLLTSEFDYSGISKASDAAATEITTKIGGAATQTEAQLKTSAKNAGASWVDMFTGVSAAARTTTSSLANDIPNAARKATAELQNTATLGGGSLRQQLQGASQSVAVLNQSFQAFGVGAPPQVFGVTAALSNMLRVGLNPVGLAIAGVTAAVGLFVASQSSAAAAAEATAEALRTERDAFLELVAAAEKAEFARARPELAPGLLDVERSVQAAEIALEGAQLRLSQAERDGAPLWVERARRSMEEAKAALNLTLLERDLIERRLRAEREDTRGVESDAESARRLAEVRALLERERGPTVEPNPPTEGPDLLGVQGHLREKAMQDLRERVARDLQLLDARSTLFAEFEETRAGLLGEPAFPSAAERAGATTPREDSARQDLERIRQQNREEESLRASSLRAASAGEDEAIAQQQTRVALAQEALQAAEAKGVATVSELETLREILRHEQQLLGLVEDEAAERAKANAVAIGKAGSAEFLAGIKEGLTEGNIKPALDGLRTALTDTILDAFLAATLKKPLEDLFGGIAGGIGSAFAIGGGGAGAEVTAPTGSAVAATGAAKRGSGGDDRKLAVVVDMSGAADEVARRMSADGSRVIVVRANEGRGLPSRRAG